MSGLYIRHRKFINPAADSPRPFSGAWRVVAALVRAGAAQPGRSRVLLRGGGPPSFAGGRPMPDPISRLQLVRDEVDKAFGAGFADKHPSW